MTTKPQNTFGRCKRFIKEHPRAMICVGTFLLLVCLFFIFVDVIVVEIIHISTDTVMMRRNRTYKIVPALWGVGRFVKNLYLWSMDVARTYHNFQRNNAGKEDRCIPKKCSEIYNDMNKAITFLKFIYVSDKEEKVILDIPGAGDKFTSRNFHETSMGQFLKKVIGEDNRYAFLIEAPWEQPCLFSKLVIHIHNAHTMNGSNLYFFEPPGMPKGYLDRNVFKFLHKHDSINGVEKIFQKITVAHKENKKCKLATQTSNQ